MKQYKIVLMKPARNFIEKQTPNIQERLLKAIYQLPHKGNIKPLTGQEDIYRLRVGNYRIIYSVHDDILTVEVMTAGNRGDIYK